MADLDKKTVEKIDLYARVILCTDFPHTYRAAIRDLVRIYVDWEESSGPDTRRSRMGFLMELLFRHGFDQTVVEIPVTPGTAWALAECLVETERHHRQLDAEHEAIGEGR